MRVHVSHSIGNLRRDLESIATTTQPKLSRVVRRNVTQGNRAAQRIARAASGPHGKNYWKRLTAEMTGPLSGEYGPTGSVVGNAVGAGWRNGPQNTDLEKSLDIQGPKFAKDVGDVADEAFWP